MTRAREHADEGAGHGTWVAARHQTEGRGRLGRGWVSERDCGLYATLLWRPAPKPFAEGVTLAVGVAVAEALEDVVGTTCTAQIKWPNDVWLSEKKVAGILVEAVSPSTEAGYLLVGIGVNLHEQTSPIAPTHPFSASPTSLTEQSLSPAQRAALAHVNSPATGLLSPAAETLLARLVVRLKEAHEAFGAAGLSPFLARYRARDALLGRTLETSHAMHAYGAPTRGKCLGIDGRGRLLLAVSGQTLKLDAGEVSRVREYGGA